MLISNLNHYIHTLQYDMLQFTELRPLALYNVSGQTKTKKIIAAL